MPRISPKRTCTKCGVEKQLQNFRPKDSHVCMYCMRKEEGTPKQDVKRQCAACGEFKGPGGFNGATYTECKVCMKKAAKRVADEAIERHRAEKIALKEIDKTVRAAVEGQRTTRLKVVAAPDKELAARVLARRRLIPFIKRFNEEYDDGWVHRDIARRLERFAEQVRAKQSPRLMLLMPPRHGKSEIASRNFPAWYLGQNPKHEVVAASYSGALSLTFSRKVREIVRSTSYGTVFADCKLDPDSQALESWMTTQGGSYTAVGVGGSLTGKGAHVLIIDDPVKDQEEADSQTIRDNIFDWYVSTARTRLAPGGGLLLIQTWWHDDDLAGRLQQAMKEGGEQFEVVKYPALNEGYEEWLDENDHIVPVAEHEEPPRGGKLLRPADTALHPERFDRDALLALKSAYVASGKKRVWQALYQQNPMPDEGLYFEKAMFRYYEAKPDLRDARIIQAWDFAITEKQTSDWTVGVCIAQTPDDEYYVLDARRFRSGDSTIIVDAMLDFFIRHNAFVLGVEDGQIWKTMYATFVKRAKEYLAERKLKKHPSLHLNKPLTDKQVRASPLRGAMQMGRVWFPKNATWFEPFERELLTFPAAKHDDCVDSLSWSIHTALAFAAPRAKDRTPKPKSWRDKLRIAALERGVGHMAA